MFPEGLFALEWWAGVLVASMGVPGVDPGGWIVGVPRVWWLYGDTILFLACCPSIGVVGNELVELSSILHGVTPWPDIFRSRGCRGVQRAILDPNKGDAACSGVSGISKLLLDSQSRKYYNKYKRH